MTPPHAPTRRELLLASGVLFAWAHLPRAARAEGRDPRFLVIVLRGALDGLATVAPVGDPDWLRLRGDKALTLDGATPALPLDSFFALNPAMPNLHRMYKARQASIVHAVASPYRERSHFDGQDVLESGLSQAGFRRQRLAQPRAGVACSRPAASAASEAFAVGPVTPLVVRGPAPVLSWTPPRLPPASDDTVMRLLDLYRHTDPALARALEERIDLAAIARAGGLSMRPRRSPACTRPQGSRRGGARLFRRSGRRRGKIHGTRRRSARRRARLRRLGHPRRRRRRQRAPGACCSARSTARWRRSKAAWARRGRRPPSPSSPSSAAPRASTAPTAPITARRRSPAGRRRAQRRPRHRRLAGLKRGEPLPGPRPQADHRSARDPQRRAARSPARRRTRAGLDGISRAATRSKQAPAW